MSLGYLTSVLLCGAWSCYFSSALVIFGIIPPIFLGYILCIGLILSLSRCKTCKYSVFFRGSTKSIFLGSRGKPAENAGLHYEFTDSED